MTIETKNYLMEGKTSGKKYLLKIEGDKILINAALRGIDLNIYNITSIDNQTFCKALEKKILEEEKLRKK